MIKCANFYYELKKNNIDFFTGVPDSLLKNFCAYVMDNTPEGKHVIAANEGNAVALASGHYLATGNPALVYMQNSGQGNALNPLLSLADPDVYSIPMILLIGWRGEPGVKDEPQHVKQGKVTLDLFRSVGIPVFVLPAEETEIIQVVRNAVKQAVSESRPVALVAKKGLFAEYKIKTKVESNSALLRERAIELIVDALPQNAIVVSTTGKTSRELYEIRERNNSGHRSDFLTVGSMGHASQIAAGIALKKTDNLVCCIDGDGATVMHMGGLSVIASLKLRNYKHIVLNNQAHESVGGQPTVGSDVSFAAIASACGYAKVFTAKNENELIKILPDFIQERGPVLLEIHLALGSRADLGRPLTTPKQNKKVFMEFLSK